MSFLIDTNVLSEIRKGPRADAGVRAWFEGTDDIEMFISVLTVGEIREGVERRRRRDPKAAEVLERWLESLVSG